MNKYIIINNKEETNSNRNVELLLYGLIIIRLIKYNNNKIIPKII